MNRHPANSLLMAGIAALVLAGCAASSGVTEPPNAASQSPRSSLRPASVQPSRVDGGGPDEIAGVLGADSVEGGCAYLQAANGTRYEVIYPDGWRIRAAPLQLMNPAGEVVATGGETITVRGREAGDMASICMIGPIFGADEVVSIER